MWVRSEWYIDNMTWGTASNDYEIFSDSGGIYIGIVKGWGPPGPRRLQYRPAPIDRWDRYGDESDYLLNKGSPWIPQLKIGSLRDDGIFPCWVLIVPYWLVIVVGLVFPSVQARRYFRQRKQRRIGLCHKCGYDLRASKDRCPECGTPTPAKTEAAKP